MPPLMNTLLQTYLGDCLKIIPKLPADSVDSVVTDPPAAIKFMGKAWDSNRGGRDQWVDWLSRVMKETMRVVKPGAFGLVWALPRTSHWTGMGLELAGWEIRDRIAHIFGTGFPKSKSCLKPAVEDWWLVKAPGKLQPLQIDACRIEGNVPSTTRGNSLGRMNDDGWEESETTFTPHENGRWPANLLLDEEASKLLDEQSGQRKGDSAGRKPRVKAADKFGWSGPASSEHQTNGYTDSGGVSRYFYCAKASKRDRGEGNTHNTVKPTSLMQWLCRLVTPPGRLILDPFMGSGSTGVAALREGFRFVGIEQDPEYVAIAKARLRREREEQREREAKTCR